MRISDWSSDVCSSDLADVVIHPLVAQHLRETFGWSDQRIALAIELAQPGDDERFEERQIIIAKISLEARVHRTGDRQPPRSEERRVGKEWVSKGRTRWSPEHRKKKKKTKQQE